MRNAFFYCVLCCSLLLITCSNDDNISSPNEYLYTNYCALGGSTASMNWQSRVALKIAKNYNNYAIGGSRWVHVEKTQIDYTKDGSKNSNNLVVTNQLIRLFKDNLESGYTPDLITIMCGLNDAALGGSTIVGSYENAFSIDMSKISPDEWFTNPAYTKLRESVYGASRFIIEKLVEKFPKAKIVIITPQSCNGGYYTYDRIKPVVDAIKVVASKYSLPVIDVFSDSGLSNVKDINSIYYRDDKIHPNTLGENLLYGFVLDKLTKINNSKE